MWQTIGHKNQKNFLQNTLDKGKYSHAYLFCGPSQIGKRTLAMEFARKILRVPESQAFNPDLMLIDNEKLKIEDTRKLISDLSLRPYQSEFKVAVVDNFENVTDEAANSILKTLEEPSPTTIIILIAANRKSVLPTIASRAQVVSFNRLTDEDVAQAAGKAVKAAEMIQLCDGKIGKAIRAREDQGYLERLRQHGADFAAIKSGDLAGRIAAIKGYSELEPVDLAETFGDWLDSEHYNVVRNAAAKYKNLEILSAALSGLRQNFNKKLVLEKVFISVT